jgi:hypothetical protein
MGHKASNAGKKLTKNRSETYQATHELCRRYLCEKYEQTRKGVLDAKMYLEIGPIKDMAKKEFKHKDEP